MWGTRATNVLVAGTYGTLLRYDGLAWIPIRSGTGNTLYALWGDDDDLWLAAGSNGTILSKRP